MKEELEGARMTSSTLIEPASATVLLALADRCEKEVPNRELDSAIHLAIAADEKFGVPYYTTSRDDAVKLVPNVFRTAHAQEYLCGGHWGWTLKSNHFDHGKSSQGVYAAATAKTAAMALCAAALRARASLNGAEATSSDAASDAATRRPSSSLPVTRRDE